MNQFIKILCLSILASAPAHAMQDYLGEQLIRAASGGNSEEIMQLIDQGAPLDYENEWCSTPLLGATQSNNHACVRMLLEANAPVDQADDCGNTVLLYAVRHGRYETLKQLLIVAKPLLINKPNQYGLTVLMEAAKCGSLNCIQALIAAGAQVNYTNADGLTALVWAARRGHLDCVQELLTAGARVKRTTMNSWLASYLNGYETDWRRYQPICELLVEAILWIPNQEQKQAMCAFLSWTKKYGKKYSFTTGFNSTWRAPLLAAVYKENKNNFMHSIAYLEVSKLQDSTLKDSLLKAFLAKYSNHANTGESSETKRAKIE